MYISREDALVHDTAFTKPFFMGKVVKLNPGGAYIFINKRRTMCYRYSQMESTISYNYLTFVCVVFYDGYVIINIKVYYVNYNNSNIYVAIEGFVLYIGGGGGGIIVVP